jgi:radical SAM protein with 4Fe4S-binding SPASM domain
VKTLSFKELSTKIYPSYSNKRVPLDATLELTYRCNNNCVHCYCNIPISDEPDNREELSTAEIRNLLDGLASMGSLHLLITGGEPLLRADFKEIYLYAKKMGFLITLFTNGILIDDDTIKLLSKYPPFVVEISLYGATEATYEKVSRVKGSYEKCMNGIKKIVGSGIKVKLKSMALTINQHEIEAIDKIAQQYRCEFRFDPILNKRIDHSNISKPEQYRIPPEDVVRLDRAFPKRMEEWKEFCDKLIGCSTIDDMLYKCGAGVTMIHINPYGFVKGCMMMVKDGFSLRTQELRWIWEEGIPSAIRRKKNFVLPCDECRLINLCGQCAAWSTVEHGDIKKEVSYLCNIAKKRQKSFSFIRYRRKNEKENLDKTRMPENQVIAGGGCTDCL